MTVQEGLALSAVPSFSGTMGFRNRDQLRIALEAPRPTRRTFWEATEVEKYVLRVISEQHALTIDQLARLFRVDRSIIERIVGEFKSKEWVEAKQLLTDEDPAVWLLSRGATLSGTKFHNYVPHYRSFPHLWAINDIRIQ